MKIFLLLVVVSSLCVACFQEGRGAQWHKVQAGHSREDVVMLMGNEPDSTKVLELPFGVRVERMVWGSAPFTDEYTVDIALNHVVAKGTRE